MQPHILAAVDGTAVSHNAERLAGRLATALGGVWSAVTAQPGGPAGHVKIEPHVHLVHGVPSVEITRHAEMRGAAMIVMGRAEPGGGAPNRSSTGEGVVRRSTIPTLHVPPGTGWFSRALIALDGSERGLMALHAGLKVADGFALPVELIAVDPMTMAPVGGNADRSVRGQRLAARLDQLSVTAPLLERHGDPVTEILAEVVADDLLVVGYRRGVDFSAPDGVGRRLIWQAPCAVLAIPL